MKKSQLQDKTIEELNYAKETSMRKKVTKECVLLSLDGQMNRSGVLICWCVCVCTSYNKTEDDFNTTDEYNDYLETLENLSMEFSALTDYPFLRPRLT